MKIELNTKTRTIKETPLKREEMLDSKGEEALLADKLSILSMAIASIIKEVAQNEGQRNKMIDSISIMIRAFLNEGEEK